ncbi:MAG: M14 family zinc carboxypeptidase [Planctomycetota bacterium]
MAPRVRRPWLIATGMALALAVSGTVSAQITLNGDFDHGSLDEANSFASGSFVQLAGRDNFNPGSWKWLYFSADNVNGLTPVFQIDDDFVTGGSNLNAHDMVYSYDQDEWFFFDNNTRNASADTYTFSNNAPFTQDEVYVAYGLPYSVGRSVAHTTAIASSPWTQPTLSGGSDFVIGQSPGGTDDIGRTIAPQDLYGYKITDPTETGPKVKIALLGGVHSNETLGNHTLEAMVDYLVGDTLDAGILRRRAEFYVYPMANPDGRLAGYNRSTVEEPDLDPNRFWDTPNYGGQSDIKAVGDAIIADTDGAVDFFIDFHSTVQKGSGHFAFIDIDRNFQLNPFWLRLRELDPTIGESDASLINDTAARFGLVELGAGFTITFETRFLAGENEDRFVTLGQDFGQAFADVLATPAGDLNFDGRVDSADYAVLVLNAETSTAGLTVIDAYARGDLNNDGANDVLDFGLFKDIFIDTNGLAAFSLLVAGVPEPTTVALLAIAGVLTAPRRAPRPSLPPPLCPPRAGFPPGDASHD